MGVRFRWLIQVLRGGERGNGGQSLRHKQRRLGWRSCIQYVGFPIVRDRGLDGQALVSHERVADEHDIVLSPSDCGQKVGEIAVAGDEDDGGWRWSVLDECHDIN